MSEAPRSIFINLISDRPANVAKALRFGRKFLAAGWSVSLYANLDAVQVFAGPMVQRPWGDLVETLMQKVLHALARANRLGPDFMANFDSHSVQLLPTASAHKIAQITNIAMKFDEIRRNSM